jgi:hypothetical protein
MLPGVEHWLTTCTTSASTGAVHYTISVYNERVLQHQRVQFISVKAYTCGMSVQWEDCPQLMDTSSATYQCLAHRLSSATCGPCSAATIVHTAVGNVSGGYTAGCDCSTLVTRISIKTVATSMAKVVMAIALARSVIHAEAVSFNRSDLSTTIHSAANMRCSTEPCKVHSACDYYSLESVLHVESLPAASKNH